MMPFFDAYAKQQIKHLLMFFHVQHKRDGMLGMASGSSTGGRGGWGCQNQNMTKIPEIPRILRNCPNWPQPVYICDSNGTKIPQA